MLTDSYNDPNTQQVLCGDNAAKSQISRTTSETDNALNSYYQHKDKHARV